MKRSGHLPMAKLAYENPKFMESLGARPLRILAEYLDPLKQLRQEKVGDTIVMFGSARIQSHDKAVAEFEKVKRKAKGRRNSEWRAKIRQARAIVGMSRYYEDARALSHKITSWAMTLGNDPKRFVICSGGGPGIMEAANRGAYEASGKSIGLSIELPNEQFANSYISPELSFNFHYFFMRKLWFAQIAKALIVFPGGFGTMDELWEMMTLSQTGKMPKHTLILIYGRKYWNDVMNLKAMVRWGTISQVDFDQLQFADNVDEAFEVVRSGLEKYHMQVDPFLQAY
jgi:uncharacterized protein (TIGR00730 family)